MDPIRAYWDFDDLDGTERRLAEALANATDDATRAELLTQLARVEGLRGDFAAGGQRVEEARRLAGSSPRTRVLVDLELGRLRRSGGEHEAALPLFESAFTEAMAAREHFLAADAAHMAALAARDREGFVAWTKRGIEIAESNETARYWLGPLLNNLGWEHFEAGELELAREAFERALAVRLEEPANVDAVALARYALAKTLRALGRPAEGIAHAEQAVAAADSLAKPDGWYHEELAETYAALGRDGEASWHAERALALLTEADPSFDPNGERSVRLRELVASRD